MHGSILYIGSFMGLQTGTYDKASVAVFSGGDTAHSSESLSCGLRVYK